MVIKLKGQQISGTEDKVGKMKMKREAVEMVRLFRAQGLVENETQAQMWSIAISGTQVGV